MKKLLLAAAFLLCATPALATKVLVVEPRQVGGTDVTTATDKESTERFYGIIREIFARFIKADIVYVSNRNVVVEDVRTGNVVWNRGKAGQYTEAFDGVILLSPRFENEGPGNLRTDSLLRVALGGPRVPILGLVSDRKVFVSDYAVATTACCTLGTTGWANPQTGQGYISQRDRTRRWIPDGQYVAAFKASATGPAAGFRKLITMGHTAMPFVLEHQGRNCGWCDSLLIPATSDTVGLFELPYANISGAKPLIMAFCDGAGGFGDSLNNFVGPLSAQPAEVTPTIILAGLARMDSLMGGTLLRKRSYAFTIDGGWTRGNRHDGFYESDSATLKRAIDSLATLNIPLTLGVNTDSLAQYPRDKAWWATLGSKLKYAPQPSTAAIGGRASYQFPHDPWGRNRNRTVYGGGDFTGADTTIDCLLAGALWKCDSTFGADRVERFVLAPNDDWTPSNFTFSMLDSLGWVAARRNMKGFRVNTQLGALTAEASSNYAGALSGRNSGFGRQFRWTEPITKKDLMIVGTNGGPIAGGSYQWTTYRDSVVPFDSTVTFVPITELTRAWYGFTVGNDTRSNIDAWAIGEAYDTHIGVTNMAPFMDVVYPKSDLYYRPTAAYIKALHVRDFSGSPTNTYWGTAPMNGWWIVKSMVNAAREINDMAGRTIIDFTYPSGVTLP